MNNKLDNYFNSKLRDHEVRPSSQAWQKVESRISKKNNTAVALRIAAAVALVAAVTVIIVNQTSDVRQEVAKSQPAQEEKRNPPSEISPAPSSTQSKAIDSPVEKNRPQVAVRKNKPSPAEIKVERDATFAEQNVVLEASVSEEIEVVAPQPTKTKRMVLVYNLPTIK